MKCDRQNALSLWTVFFGSFYFPYGPRKSKFEFQSYDIWLFRYGVQQTKLFITFDRFLLFYPRNNPKNQNFEKLKKAPGDIIILHKCIKNQDHMLSCSLDMARNGFNFHFFILGYFLPFYHSNSPKSQNLEKVKKTPRDIIILKKYTKNYDYMLHCS